MPNHCDHDFTIWGPEASLDDFRRAAVTDDGAIDCDAIIPYPDAFKKLDAAAELWDKSEREARERRMRDGTVLSTAVLGPRPKDGFNSGGYEWCINNWGTKWGTYDADTPQELPPGTKVGRFKVKEGQKGLFLCFLSAWGPPLPVFKLISERWPDLSIGVSYYEQGMAFQGRWSYFPGVGITHTEGDYHGTRGG